MQEDKIQPVMPFEGGDKIEVAQLDDVVNGKSAAVWEQLLRDAEIAEEEEKKMPLKQALRVYPKAMLWTFGVTLSFVM